MKKITKIITLNTLILSLVTGILLGSTIVSDELIFSADILSKVDDNDKSIRETLSEEAKYIYDNDFGGFILPNEQNPCKAIPLFQSIEPGRTYLSVGTERSFIGAFFTKAQYLVTFDLSHAVWVTNEINVLLLQAAKDTAHYRHLRTNASLKEWKIAFKKAGIKFENGKYLKNIRRLREFYLNRVTRSNVPNMPYGILTTDYPESSYYSTYKKGYPSHIFSPGDKLGDAEEELYCNMTNTNYTYDEEMFSYLKAMATEGRIFNFKHNISNADENSELFLKIRELDTPLGILDASNIITLDKYCYQNPIVGKLDAVEKKRYCQYEDFLGFLITLSSYADQETIVLSTNFGYRSKKLKQLDIQAKKRGCTNQNNGIKTPANDCKVTCYSSSDYSSAEGICTEEGCSFSDDSDDELSSNEEFIKKYCKYELESYDVFKKGRFAEKYGYAHMGVYPWVFMAMPLVSLLPDESGSKLACYNDKEWPMWISNQDRDHEYCDPGMGPWDYQQINEFMFISKEERLALED